MAKKKEQTKEITTQKEALALLAARFNCAGQGCIDCPMQYYYDEECSTTMHKLTEKLAPLMAQFFGVSDAKVFAPHFAKEKPAVAAYDAVMAMDIPEIVLQDQKPEQKDEPKKEGRCFTCLMSQMHTSGILWCKSFGNFVHEDGFCYRYKSDKIETEEPVDN